MSTKDYKKIRTLGSQHIDLNKLEAYSTLNNDKLADLTKFNSYNEYTADQVSKFPEIFLAFMQYEGGDDAMFYLQLIWMNDFYEGKKNLVT